MWRSTARFKVIVAGRRWGKTLYARVRLAWHAGTPGRYWYVAPTYRMARDIFWADFKQAIDPTWWAVPPNETLMELDTIWGARFALKGPPTTRTCCAVGAWRAWLDEPSLGLDPAGIVEIRELLLELTRQQGATVFMSSHILAEVSRLARRIGIIHQGHLLQELNIDELERDLGRRLLLRVRQADTAQQALIAAGLPAKILPDGAIELDNPAAIDRPDEINRLLVVAGASPTHLVVEEEDLEQYFLRLIGMDGGPQNE